MKKVYLTWDDIDSLVNVLAKEIEASPVPPNYITGLQRGGLIPAVMLSHKLNIPFVRESMLRSLPAVDILVVDDIADTGETLSQYRIYSTAVLHYKLQSEHIPTFFAAEIADTDWIVYPWEREDSETIQDYLKNEQGD
jgi:hypoxanthine phosphoribosyltransferase